MADLIKRRTRLLRTYRSHRGRRGGAEFIPYHCLHWVVRELTRVTPAENSAKWFDSKGRVKRGLPCPRACSEFETAMAGRSAPCTDRRCTILEGTDAFARFLFARGPFQASSKYAPLNSLLKDHPEGISQDAALPVIKTRRHKKFVSGPIASKLPAWPNL